MDVDRWGRLPKWAHEYAKRQSETIERLEAEVKGLKNDLGLALKIKEQDCAITWTRDHVELFQIPASAKINFNADRGLREQISAHLLSRGGERVLYVSGHQIAIKPVDRGLVEIVSE
ncbi:MAG: hypothetical protein QNJ16_18330 [Rhodobacter sp.]|nr:hypothetical protein [Rhodobacter sp.]